MNHLRQSKIYRHKFRNQLQTAHGKWSERESIVLREQDEEGRVSFGELCPTPGFISSQLDELYPIVKDWEMGNDYNDNTLISSAISCIRSEIWDPPITRKTTKEVFTAELYSNKTKERVFELEKLLSGKRFKNLFTPSGMKNQLQFFKSLKISDLARMGAELEAKEYFE